ncbi:MAG: hypothetical protein IKP32_00085 [Clostridia bacterium]|nr:hypothetical protein [Clostridia bacterium]
MTMLHGRTHWRVHPVLPLLWGLCALMGGHTSLIASLLALLLHECGHFLMARWLCIPIAETEITPWGGVIRLDGAEAVPAGQRFLLALGGPLFSLLGCFLAAELHRLGADFWFSRCFARMNLTMLLLNLLPALPLDGGRMLHAILSRWVSPIRLTRYLTVAGYAVGGLLCGLTVLFAFRGEMVLAPCFAGLYLIYAAGRESRHSVIRYMTGLIARRQQLDRGAVLPVEILAAGANTTSYQILSRLRPGYVHVVHVLSPDGLRRIDTLDEKDLCDLIAGGHGAPVTLGQRKKAGPASPAPDPSHPIEGDAGS